MPTAEEVGLDIDLYYEWKCLLRKSRCGSSTVVRGPGGKEKEWTDCVVEDRRALAITGDGRTAALKPGVWYYIYSTVCEGGTAVD